MFLSAFAVACSLVVTHAAPQGNPACADVPTNPAAGQIDAQYLNIPGCSSGNSNLLSDISPVSTTIATPLPAINTPTNQPQSPAPALPQSDSSSSSSSSSNSSSLSSTSSSSNSSSSTVGLLFKSSITRYGQGPPGTPGTDKHCQAHEGSCGNNPKSGWTAAASQFLYFHGGSGLGGGTPGSPGAACGTCWRVTGSTDSSSNPLSPPAVPAVVLITNECAAQDPGQPVNLCGMASLTDTNSLGANVNIDLCMDSGAAMGFFNHPAPWGTAVGTAQQVDCASEWCGVWSNGTKSGPEGCVAPGAGYADTT